MDFSAQLLEEKNNYYIYSSLNVLDFYLVAYVAQYPLFFFFFKSKLNYVPELGDFLVATTEMTNDKHRGRMQ